MAKKNKSNLMVGLVLIGGALFLSNAQPISSEGGGFGVLNAPMEATSKAPLLSGSTPSPVYNFPDFTFPTADISNTPTKKETSSSGGSVKSFNAGYQSPIKSTTYGFTGTSSLKNKKLAKLSEARADSLMDRIKTKELTDTGFTKEGAKVWLGGYS